MRANVEAVKNYRNNYIFETSKPDTELIQTCAKFWDGQATPFNHQPRLLFCPGNLLISSPLKNASGLVIASSFVPASKELQKEWDVDLGYKVFSCALEASQHVSVCIETAFDAEKAKQECAELHSMEYKCPIAIVIGQKAVNGSLFTKIYDWIKFQPERLSLDKICEGHNDVKNSKLKEALNITRLGFSFGNAQNWRFTVDDSKVRFFTASDLELRYVNVGFSMAAFEIAAREFRIKGKWIVEKAIQHRDWEYVLTWLVE